MKTFNLSELQIDLILDAFEQYSSILRNADKLTVEDLRDLASMDDFVKQYNDGIVSE